MSYDAAQPVAREEWERAPPGLQPQPGDALLVIDLQRDFLPGGSLAVPGGEAVLAPVDRCLARFDARGLPIVASRDWHPLGHASFLGSGGRWPQHCVADSPGAAFDRRLRLPPGAGVVSKGTTGDSDGERALAEMPSAGARLAEAEVVAARAPSHLVTRRRDGPFVPLAGPELQRHPRVRTKVRLPTRRAAQSVFLAFAQGRRRAGV